jgi:hypothetical protein
MLSLLTWLDRSEVLSSWVSTVMRLIWAAFAAAQVYDVLTDEDRAELAGLDVVCEICSIPFAADGRPVRTT